MSVPTFTACLLSMFREHRGTLAIKILINLYIAQIFCDKTLFVAMLRKQLILKEKIVYLRRDQ